MCGMGEVGAAQGETGAMEYRHLPHRVIETDQRPAADLS